MTEAEISALIDSNLASNTRITAVKHREVEHALLDYIAANLPKSGDVKTVVCDATYLAANFNTTPGATFGLGTNERLGWAIMNGNNGTPNDDGLVEIAYGETHLSLESTTGSETHTLTTGEMPPHSHTIAYDLHNASGGGSEATLDINGGGSSGTKATSSVGSGTAFSIMQPSRVRLRIMKL